jgi:hypothetical protein
MGSVCMYGEMLHSCDLLQGYMNQDCRTSGIITVTGRDGSLPSCSGQMFHFKRAPLLCMRQLVVVEI